MNEIIKSNWFKIAAVVVASILIVLLSFAVGVMVGSKKALFSCNWGKNYERNFVGERPPFGQPGSIDPMMRGFEGKDFRNAHGVAGKIVSVAEDKLVIKDREGKENTVAVTDKTIIKKNRMDNLKLSDLKNDDEVVVMGKPDGNGTIEADLIRVFNVSAPNNNNQLTQPSNNQSTVPSDNQPIQNNNQ